MFRGQQSVLPVVFHLVIVSVPACAGTATLNSGFDSTVPQIGYLKARIDALYQAEHDKDWRSWYLMTSPEIRKESTYEAFLKDFSSRKFELVSWRIRRIDRIDDPERSTGVLGAKVGMDVHTQEGNGPLEHDTDQTDYWLYLDGEWYWSWRGWPDD